MCEKRFDASVQYNDFKGTSAADWLDGNGFLEGKGLLRPGESLVGVRVWAGEYHGGERSAAEAKKTVAVTFLVVPFAVGSLPRGKKGDGWSTSIREIDAALTPAEFFALFKRFSAAVSARGILTNVEYTPTEIHSI